MRIVLGVLFIAALGGCASVPGSQDTVAALRAFAVRDLSTARDIAVAGGDKAGAQCLTYLAAKAEALAAAPAPAGPPPDLSLPISDLERLRVAIHAPSVGASFLEDLDLHCAALRTSIEIDLVKGAMVGASIAGSGGATAPAAGLKAIPVLLRLLKMTRGG